MMVSSFITVLCMDSTLYFFFFSVTFLQPAGCIDAGVKVIPGVWISVHGSEEVLGLHPIRPVHGSHAGQGAIKYCTTLKHTTLSYSAKGCGFSSQGTHILMGKKKKCIAWMHCKSLWIKASAKWKWKWRDIRPSMVTHTRNLCSAFNPSKCTHTAVNSHTEQWAAIYAAAVGGSVPCSRAPQSWYWRWRERCTFTPPTYNRDSNLQPFNYESDSNH